MMVEVLHPRFHTVTFGRLETEFVCKLGRGGRATVLLVKVRRQQLLALTKQTPALEQLLQNTVCSCGGSVSGSGSSGGVCCCCCSVLMALKVAATYDELPRGWRNYYSPQQYAKVAVTDCVCEYNIMDTCFESAHIINCYALGRTMYMGSEGPCVVVE